MSGQDIYENFTNGAGNRATESAVESLRAVVEDYQVNAAEMRALTAAMEVSWQGDASGAALRGAAPLVVEHETAEPHLAQTGFTGAGHGILFEASRALVRPVPEEPVRPGVWDNILSLGGATEDYESDVRAYNAANEANVEAMRNYESATGDHVDLLPKVYGAMLLDTTSVEVVDGQAPRRVEDHTGYDERRGLGENTPREDQRGRGPHDNGPIPVVPPGDSGQTDPSKATPLPPSAPSPTPPPGNVTGPPVGPGPTAPAPNGPGVPTYPLPGNPGPQRPGYPAPQKPGTPAPRPTPAPGDGADKGTGGSGKGGPDRGPGRGPGSTTGAGSDGRTGSRGGLGAGPQGPGVRSGLGDGTARGVPADGGRGGGRGAFADGERFGGRGGAGAADGERAGGRAYHAEEGRLGNRAGTGALGAGESVGGRGGGAAAGGRGAGGGLGGPVAGGLGANGDEDGEHSAPEYLVIEDPDELFGNNIVTAPPVIGG